MARRQTLADPAQLTPTPNNLPAPTNSFIEAARVLPQPPAFMRFNGRDNDWSRDGEPIDPNCKFFAQEPRYGWRYIQAGHPSEDYPDTAGQPPSDRRDHPHQDQSLWDVDENGQPVDPVKQYISVTMICLNDGRRYIYDALNPSSRRALTGLINRIAWESAAHTPGAKAILTLGSAKVVNGLRQYFVPAFAVVGWLVQDQHGNWQPEPEITTPTTGKIIDDNNPW